MWYIGFMVKISELNKICANRLTSKEFPAQIICRLFGNKFEPCKIDRICATSEEKGLWYLYLTILLFLLLSYLVFFWLLKVTRISKILYPVVMLLIIPLGWLATCGAACIQFIRKLPF